MMNGTYDLALLLASCCVAWCTSYAALSLGGRIALLQGEHRRVWLCGGAVATGTGLWAMHIVGMSALELPMTVSYDPAFTLLSWSSACGVAALALAVTSRKPLGLPSLAGAALLMGSGLCLMLYSSAWAMRLTPGIGYDFELLAAAAASAVLSAAAVLFIAFSVQRQGQPDTAALPLKIAAALGMGAALCVTHYTGLSALRFAPGALCDAGNLLGGSWMGLPLALIVVGLLGAVQLLSRMDALAAMERSRSETQRREIERVRRMAYYDPVTGLPNRSLFNETLLRQLINVSGNPPPAFGVVYAELRGYRALVEKLGQDRVNLILKSLAGQLPQSLRDGDMLARLSHDGFACLLREHSDRNIETGTAQLGERFGTPTQCDNQTFRLVWGIGASSYPQSGTSTQALVRAAMKLQFEVGGERKPVRQEIRKENDSASAAAQAPQPSTVPEPWAAKNASTVF
jgi:diguanylate cyclase (GGDEF)-like protein